VPSGQGLAAARGNRVSRSTAETATLLRAVGALLPDRRLRGPDVLAARFIPWARRAATLIKIPGLRLLVVRALKRKWPGALNFELVRTKYMDDVVREEIGAGAIQVVVLGAGFDSRAYRLPETRRAIVFEVDHPVTSVRKRSRVRRLFGEPSHVRYATIDFNREDLAEVLRANGYDDSARSVVVWSGVTPYLEPASVEATIRWMARQAPGSCLVFDYCWQEVIDGTATEPGARAVAASVAASGEPWLWGIPRGRGREHLAERGLDVVEELTTPVARQRYLTEAAGPIWTFGGFLRARVPGGSAPEAPSARA
jgi:methyltransferase (TIGR00027 family)